MTPIHKNLPKKIFIAVFAIVIIGYIAFNFRVFIAGPSIIVSTPIDGSKVTESLINVLGVAKQISHISLNGRSILINENNEFDEFLLLTPGYNIITLEARDKFGRQVIEKINIVYENNFNEYNVDALPATSTLRSFFEIENDISDLDENSATSSEEISEENSE